MFFALLPVVVALLLIAANVIVSAQVNAFEFSRAAQVVDDAEAVAEIVGDEERVVIVADGETCRVNGRV